MIIAPKPECDSLTRASRTTEWILLQIKHGNLANDDFTKRRFLLDVLYTTFGIEVYRKKAFDRWQFGGCFISAMGWNGHANHRYRRFWTGSTWVQDYERAKKFKDKKETNDYIVENYQALLWR